MSRELRFRLPGPVDQQLRALAVEADQTPTRVAVQLLTHALAGAARKGGLPVPAIETAPALAGARPAPLLPLSSEDQIPGTTWRAIVDLHARYPGQLDRLKVGWWKDNSHLETLTALASWRAELDGAPNHFQELAYQHQLLSYAQRLRSEPGGTASIWKTEARDRDAGEGFPTGSV